MKLSEWLSHLLSDEEAKEFVLWGFGEEYFEFHEFYTWAKRWNDLHKDKLYIYYLANIYQDIKKMIELWRKETKDKSNEDKPT